MEIIQYFLSFLLSFAYVFLKGWQHQNVNGRHMKSVAVVSYLMAVVGVAEISLVIQVGWTIALTGGTGGAIGMVTSMYFHDYFYKDKS